MKRMKTFLKYAIIIVLLYFISNLIIDYSLRTNYKTMDAAASKVESSNYNIEITGASATNANGEISGKISKKEGSEQNDKYMKVDFINQRNQVMGTQYFEIGDLAEGKSKEFKIPFVYSGITSYRITTVNEIDNQKPVKILKNSYWGIAVLIAMIFLVDIL